MGRRKKRRSAINDFKLPKEKAAEYIPSFLGQKTFLSPLPKPETPIEVSLRCNRIYVCSVCKGESTTLFTEEEYKQFREMHLHKETLDDKTTILPPL